MCKIKLVSKDYKNTDKIGYLSMIQKSNLESELCELLANRCSSLYENMDMLSQVMNIDFNTSEALLIDKKKEYELILIVE